ncbi:MAG TPA: hypothetical protein VJ717_07305 [Gemmatimonadaceae bacterium]|nr:hypothetical protein [Gemmatimonadaceae bacterium]
MSTNSASTNGSGSTLGWLADGVSSVATGISSNGWIVGYAEYSDAPHRHAFLASIFGGMQDLGPLATDYMAADISARKRIVGTIFPEFRSGAENLAWTWKDGTFGYLPTPQSLGSVAEAVNTCGTVVGHTWDPNAQVSRAVRWIRRACDP